VKLDEPGTYSVPACQIKFRALAWLVQWGVMLEESINLAHDSWHWQQNDYVSHCHCFAANQLEPKKL
jgi:hypothetical protein